jgi:hypothetical protein
MIWALFFWPPAAVAGAIGAYALNAAVPNVTLAGTLFLAGPVLMALPFLMPGRVLRFHERGLTDKRPLKGTQTIHYEEIEHMTWRQVKPSVGVHFEGWLAAAGRTLHLSAKVDTGGPTQQKLETVRDLVAAYVGKRARRQIAAGQPFAWGRNRGTRVQLRQDGIAYHPVRFVGGGDEQVLAWTSDVTFAMDDGVFSLCAAGSKDVLFSLECDAPDFYPGLNVFGAMRGRRQQAG